MSTTLKETFDLERRGAVTSMIIYEAICKNPNLTVYEYAKIVDSTTGKVDEAIEKLERKGLVKTKIIAESPHVERIAYPTPAKELIEKFVSLD